VIKEEKIQKPVIQESHLKNFSNDKNKLDNFLNNKLLFSHNIQIKEKENINTKEGQNAKEVLVLKTPDMKNIPDLKK
jgi:hypothetical protein